MFTRFDTNKSTKGASKLRRDLINAEIANLRDLLPLPQSTRQRLSQLQLMALVCVYVRKANYFRQVLKQHELFHYSSSPNIGFSKALSGFLMMLTQNGKLLYISDNAAEYLGHSMEDLLIHGDSVYDIIDKQDHSSIQTELGRNMSHLEGERRMFLCRMNVSRNARRQMRFGDQKVVLVQGQYLSYLPLCSRNEPVFLATCTPIAMPETRECVVQGATNIFTTIHSMEMKIINVDKNGEFYLGYQRSELQGLSWYQLLHWDSIKEAHSKHKHLTQSEQDRSAILLVQMQKKNGEFVWVHCVLQVRNGDDNQHPLIVCTNQVLSNNEASVMRKNSWLYQNYSLQSKIQFGMNYDQTPTVIQCHSPPLSHQYFNSSHSMAYQGLNHHIYTPPHPHLQYEYHSPNGTHNNPIYYEQNHNSHLGHANYSVLSQTNYDKSLKDEKERSLSDYQKIETSPPIKKRMITRPDPIQIHSPEGSLTKFREWGSVEETNQTLLLGSVGHATRNPFVGKYHSNPNSESTEFIDKWNPSPPWSDTAQKVPDITLHELRSYTNLSTPPTPNSGSISNSSSNSPGGIPSSTSSYFNPNKNIFSFDLTAEQMVPIVGYSTPPEVPRIDTIPLDIPKRPWSHPLSNQDAHKPNFNEFIIDRMQSTSLPSVYVR